MAIAPQWNLETSWKPIIGAFASGGCEAYMRVLATRYLTVVDSEPLFSLEIYACGGMYAGKEVGQPFYRA